MFNLSAFYPQDLTLEFSTTSDEIDFRLLDLITVFRSRYSKTEHAVKLSSAGGIIVDSATEMRVLIADTDLSVGEFGVDIGYKSGEEITVLSTGKLILTYAGVASGFAD